MSVIKFSHNWNNKLNCNVFTTIRKHTHDKLKYYDSVEGDVFDVLLNGAFLFKARLADVDSGVLSVFNHELLKLDAGLSDINDVFDVFRKFRINKDDGVIILTFEKV